MKHLTRLNIVLTAAISLSLNTWGASTQSGLMTLASVPLKDRSPLVPSDKTAQIPTDEIESEETKDVKLSTNCGQTRVEKTETMKVPEGATYVRHEVNYLTQDPPEKPDIAGCKDTWDAKLKTLTVTCRCEVQSECKKKNDKWNDRPTVLEARIHLFTRKPKPPSKPTIVAHLPISIGR